MYAPAAFAESNLSELHDFIDQNSFGVLVSQVEGVPFASHLPFLLERTTESHGTLVGHMAQANPQWQDAGGQRGPVMLPLYEDPQFTFRFAEARIIPRFHLEGIEAGRGVSVFRMDPGTGERLYLLAAATVGEGGWVDLPEPIIVRAGEAFVAVPERERGKHQSQ